jgi:HK97 family phage portal protein
MRMPWSKQTESLGELRFAPLTPTNPLPEQKSFTIARDGDSVGFKQTRLLYQTPNYRDPAHNSIVMACVLWGGRNIQQAPPRIYIETSTGFEKKLGHPVQQLLENPQGNLRPEERSGMTGRMLLSAVLSSSMYTGQSFCLKVRNGSGQVVALDWLPWHIVRIVKNSKNNLKVDYYEVMMANGQPIRYAREDIWHAKPFGVDPENPIEGLNPLRSVMRQVLTDNQIAQYSEAIMKSPTPSFAVTPTSFEMSPSIEEATEFQRQMIESMSGEKAGRPFVPNFPADVKVIGFSPDKMAIDIIQKLPEQRVCAVFGIPAIVVGMGAGLDRSTFANMKEARESATEEFLVPMWDAIADSLNESLRSEMLADGEIVKFDTSSVRALQEDKDALHKRSREDFGANGINRAEYRQAIGLEPMPGDEQTWSYQLRPVMSPAVPQGASDAQKARLAAENG